MHWPTTTSAILAANLLDGDTIVGAIVILVSIITWLFKTVAQANQKGPPVANRPRPPVRPRDDRLQREIDIFLQESGAKKGSRPAATQTAAPAAKGLAAKGPAAKTPPSKTAPSKAAGAGAPARPGDEARPARPARRDIRERSGKEITPRSSASAAELGKGVQSGLQQFNQKVSEEATPQLPHNVDQLVAQHFGQSGPSLGQADASSLLSHRVVELLRQPDGLRQAIALNLILSPPLASRRRPSR